MNNTNMDHLEDAAELEKNRHESSRTSKSRGGGRPQDRNTLVSKALSKLLRHQADNAGVKLDEGGWAELDKVLAYGPIRSLKTTMEDIRSVIGNSDKTRFAIKPNSTTNPLLDENSTNPSHFLIRANQGHSIKLDSAALLSPITHELANVPALVVHGTYLAYWPSIESSGGLKRMTRNHVHFATALPDEIKREVSGMRKDSEVLIYVDIEAALNDGVQWWLSDNGVVLTEGDAQGLVSSKYFKEVIVRTGDTGTIWRDGEKVADVPEGLKGRQPPQARGGRGGRGGGRGRGR